jgi:plastocyanin
MFSTVSVATLLLAACSSALPTSTLNGATWKSTEISSSPTTTHTVSVDLGGLRFDPDNMVAEIGDVIEFRFSARNHSVIQSSFEQPCAPMADGSGFRSGSNFATTENEQPDAFQVVVQDKAPIWFYCGQPVGNHCQSGMVGVINQNTESSNTLAQYRTLAATSPHNVAPEAISGGQIIPGVKKRQSQSCTEERLLQCTIADLRPAEACFQELCL